jgi:glucose/arabinose dehydrogenase
MLSALTLAAALVAQPVALADGRRFSLNLPPGYELHVAAEGLRRVRFMAMAPDRRLFVTDMYNRTDNKRGKVYVLDGFDREKRRFASITSYLTGLRNPNSIAFHDGWLYVAQTDKLVRYRYENGSRAPSGEPEVLATFPDYGLDYKYGGWHLTRTIAIGPNEKLYVSVGSSCNACVEKEEVRATVMELNLDGSQPRVFAKGLRNAVGLKFKGSTLYATNMGADHLGDAQPRDTFYALRDGSDYGWPYCYVMKNSIRPDARFSTTKARCAEVPKPQATFPAHASPLGLDTFGDDDFLVALHGSSKTSLNHGYRVARVRNGVVEDFMTGFLDRNTKVVGRPADILRLDDDSFFVTDDYAGVIYYVVRTSAAGSADSRTSGNLRP